MAASTASWHLPWPSHQPNSSHHASCCTACRASSTCTGEAARLPSRCCTHTHTHERLLVRRRSALAQAACRGFCRLPCALRMRRRASTLVHPTAALPWHARLPQGARPRRRAEAQGHLRAEGRGSLVGARPQQQALLRLELSPLLHLLARPIHHRLHHLHPSSLPSFPSALVPAAWRSSGKEGGHTRGRGTQALGVSAQRAELVEQVEALLPLALALVLHLLDRLPRLARLCTCKQHPHAPCQHGRARLTASSRRRRAGVLARGQGSTTRARGDKGMATSDASLEGRDPVLGVVEQREGG